MPDSPLKCACGTVQGVAKQVTPTTGIRLVCHCDDCQAFANYLELNTNQPLRILDDCGGTEIFQMPIAYVEINQGEEQLRCLKLSPKGIIRWYTDCCKTPVGNTLSASMAFIGVIHSFMDDQGQRDQNLGPIKGYLQTSHAKKTVDSKPNHPKFPIGLTLKIVANLLKWKLKGLNQPSAFFDSNGHPVSTPKIIRE